MQTFKYVVKRILLAILILFGVSVIIYALARMMPTDYIDNQYASAVNQGTMTQNDVDRIKEIYGLSMPDAYLSMTPGETSEYSGVTFTAKTREDDKYSAQVYEIYEDDGSMSEMTVESLRKAYARWYTDSYESKKGDLRLYIRNVGKSAENKANDVAYYSVTGDYEIYSVRSAGSVSVEGGDKENTDGEVGGTISLQEELELKESGKYEVVLSDGVANLVLTPRDKAESTLKVSYRVASFWDKMGAVMGGYFTWLFNLLKGDMGMSFKYKEPVGSVIMKNMGISFGIALVATILQFVISIPLGIKAATKQYGVIDYTVTVLTMIGISLPTFFLAALFIRVFAVQLGWFPVSGAHGALPIGASWFQKTGDLIWHMILPMTVLVILSIGGLMRYTRTNTLEVLNADYIRTARAKGLSERTVVYKHAFRNTMIPIVTLLAGILPSLFGGAMITETVFGIPGIGKIAYDALIVADVPFIMGYNMFIAILTVIGTLLSDLMYAVVDPRVKIGR